MLLTKATTLSDGVSLDRDESLLEDVCSAGTKVQILTLYWYKSTNTDAEDVCSAEDGPVLVYAIALAWDAVSGGIVFIYIYIHIYITTALNGLRLPDVC
jgi:hypothetical protein